MDDDNQKSVVEKLVDKVNDTVANIVNTAAAAAMKAMEPEPDPAKTKSSAGRKAAGKKKTKR
jgi:ribosomal protein S10